MQRIRLSQRATMRCVRCQRTWASASFSRYCCDGCMQGNSHCDTCTAVVSPDGSKVPPRSPASVSRGRKKSRERHTQVRSFARGTSISSASSNSSELSSHTIQLPEKVTLRCTRCFRQWSSSVFTEYCCTSCHHNQGHSATCPAVQATGGSPVRGPPAGKARHKKIMQNSRQSRSRHHSPAVNAGKRRSKSRSRARHSRRAPGSSRPQVAPVKARLGDGEREKPIWIDSSGRISSRLPAPKESTPPANARNHPQRAPPALPRVEADVSPQNTLQTANRNAAVEAIVQLELKSEHPWAAEGTENRGPREPPACSVAEHSGSWAAMFGDLKSPHNVWRPQEPMQDNKGKQV